MTALSKIMKVLTFLLSLLPALASAYYYEYEREGLACDPDTSDIYWEIPSKADTGDRLKKLGVREVRIADIYGYHTHQVRDEGYIAAQLKLMSKEERIDTLESIDYECYGAFHALMIKYDIGSSAPRPKN